MGQKVASIAYNEEYIDINTVGLSKTQVSLIKEYFYGILDGYNVKDGKMTTSILSKLLSIPKSDAQLVIDYVDLDGDGQLDDYDFICMVGLFTKSKQEEKLEALFSLFDEDYSQIISEDEFEKLIRCVLCINEHKREIENSQVTRKMEEIQEKLFLDKMEMKMDLFLTLAKEDQEIQQALLKLGIFSPDEVREDFCEDLEMEYQRGQEEMRGEDQEIYEKKRLGLEIHSDQMFEEDNIEADHFMAVKPYLGAIRNSVPTNFKDSQINLKNPEANLELEFVHGFRCFDTRNNIFFIDPKTILFHSAGVGIVMDTLNRTQKFNFENTDDITCIDRYEDLVVTGQIGHRPIINIWSVSNINTISVIVGDLQKGIAHVCFSPNGQYLAASAMNDDHDLAIYDVSIPQQPKLIAKSKGCKDVVLQLKFSLDSKNIYIATRRELYLAHFNKKGIKINKTTGWGKNKQPVLCIGFLSSSCCVAGLKNGNLAIVKGRSVTKTVPAHKSIVFAIENNSDHSKLFTGGGDGKVKIWDNKLNLLEEITINDKSFKSVNPKIRALSFEESNNKLLIGTRGGEIIEYSIPKKRKKFIIQGHFNKELWGLANHPVLDEYVTVGEDFLLAKWSIVKRQQINSTKLRYQAKTCSISSNGNHIAVGCTNGYTLILNYANFSKIKQIKTSRKEITQTKYSKDNNFLAVGARDARIYIYEVKKYKRIAICKGHHSTITHLDFSEDGDYLQSNCTSYELLYWNTRNGKQDTRGASNNRDEKWASWTCVLGWPVQGIYPPCADGTDVNSVDRMKKSKILASGDDFGTIKLFQFPNFKGSSYNQFIGHSSHVTNVRFNQNDKYLISTGGNDKSIFQWKVEIENEDQIEYEEDYEQEDGLELEDQEEEDYGMFEQIEEEEGAEMGAVKNYKGQVDNSIPSDFKLEKGMEDAPNENLFLHYINGYRCFDARYTAQISQDQKVVFVSAALGVEMDAEQNSQSFFNEHEEDVVSFDLHPDRQIAASGQMAMKGKSRFIDIFVWDIKSKKVLANLKGFHRRAVQLLRFSPDGSKLFSFGKDDDNSLAVYDWQNERLIATSKVDKKNVLDLGFFSSNNFTTCGSRHLKVWHLSGSRLKGSTVSWKGHGNAESVISCTGVTNSLAVIGTASGKLISLKGSSLTTSQKLHKGRIYCIYYDKQSQKLFTGGQDGIVNMLNLSGNKFQKEKQIINLSKESFKGRIRALDVFKEQMLIGTGASELFLLEDYQYSENKKKILSGHYEGELWGLSCSPNKDEYTTIGDDKTVRVWDINTLKMKYITKINDKGRAIHYSNNGNNIVVATYKGEIILFDKKLKEISRLQSKFTKSNQWIEEIKFSPNDKYLAFGAHGGASKVEVLKILKKDGKQKLKRVGLGNVGLTSALLHLDWDIDSSLLVVNSQAYELKFMSVDTLKDVRASSCKDIEWQSWTCKIGFPVQGILSGVDGTEINTVDRSHNKQLLVTGEDSQLVKLFKYPSVVPNSNFKSYKGHASHVTRTRFTFNDNYVVTIGGNDKTSIIWKTDINKEIEDEEEDDEDDFVQKRVKKEEEYDEEEFQEEEKEGMFDYEEAEDTEFMAVKPWLGAIKAPSDFIEPKYNSNEPPNIEISLEYVYGYRAKDCRNNLFFVNGNLLYYAAAVAIKLNQKNNTQKFVNDHADDIISMAYSKTKNIFATGELGPKPTINIWNPDDMEIICKLNGGVIKGVSALAFSQKGDKLAAVCIDDNHMVAVYDIDKQCLIACEKGDTAKIVDVEWINDSSFVTVGLRHFKSWSTNGILKGKRGSFAKGSSDKLVCAKRFMQKILCGSVKGELQVWSGGACTKNIKFKVKVGCIDAIHITSSNKIIIGGKGNNIIILNSQLKSIKTINLNQFLFSGMINKVRAIDTNEDETELYIGIYSSQIFKIYSESMKGIEDFEVGEDLLTEELMSGHFAKNLKWTNEVWGLWPLSKNNFLSVSDDSTLRLWSGNKRKMLKYLNLNIDQKGQKLELDKKTKDLQEQAKLRSVTSTSDESHIAVGCKEGTVRIISFSKWKQIKLIKHRKRWISDLRYSPDNSKLAVGSHDAYIDIYNVKKNYRRLFKLKKHSAYITHLDWSKDGSFLQSNCGAYELLFWDVEGGRQLTSGGTALRDEEWNSWSCVLGWPVQGIFQPEWDGTDVNMVDRSQKEFEDEYKILATSDDFGKIRIYRYPCLNKGGSKSIILKGHSSHVTNVKFNHLDEKIYSAGGEDQCMMQWKISS